MVKTASGKTDMRSFAIIAVKNNKGDDDKQSMKVAIEMRMIGRTHRSAASKALTGLCKYKKLTGSCVMFITVKETTQGSEGKELTYKCRRYKMDEPLEINGRTYEYTNDVKSIKGSVKRASKMARGSTKKSRKSSKKTKKSTK